MACIAAVSVNQQFAAGKTCVRYWAAYYKTACAIHKYFSVLIYQGCRDDRLNDLLDDLVPDGFIVGLRVMMGADNDSFDTLGFAVAILHRYL